MLTIALTMLLAAQEAAPAPPTAGVAPMTPERIVEAIAAGEAAAQVDTLYVSSLGSRRRGQGEKGVLTTGFWVSVKTPFSMVAEQAFLAKKKLEPLTPSLVTVPPIEEQTVEVTVTPNGSGGWGSLYVVEAIRTVSVVAIQLGPDLIRPVRFELEDLEFSNAYGGRKEVAKGGRFYFPLGAFDASKGSIVIVIIPESGSATERWEAALRPKDLQKLR